MPELQRNNENKKNGIASVKSKTDMWAHCRSHLHTNLETNLSIVQPRESGPHSWSEVKQLILQYLHVLEELESSSSCSNDNNNSDGKPTALLNGLFSDHLSYYLV